MRLPISGIELREFQPKQWDGRNGDLYACAIQRSAKSWSITVQRVGAMSGHGSGKTVELAEAAAYDQIREESTRYTGPSYYRELELKQRFAGMSDQDIQRRLLELELLQAEEAETLRRRRQRVREMSPEQMDRMLRASADDGYLEMRDKLLRGVL